MPRTKYGNLPFELTPEDLARIEKVKKIVKERKVLDDKISDLQNRYDELYDEMEDMMQTVSNHIASRLEKEAHAKVKTLPKTTEDGREITYEVIEEYDDEVIDIGVYDEDNGGEIYVPVPYFEETVGGYPLTPEQAKEVKAAKAILAKYANMPGPKAKKTIKKVI